MQINSITYKNENHTKLHTQTNTYVTHKANVFIQNFLKKLIASDYFELH